MSRGRRRNTPEGSRAGFSAKSHVCYDSAMNYRRGFQRLYAVFTLAWVVVLLFALPADRLKFWRIGGWDVVSQTPAPAAPPDLSQYGTVTPAPPRFTPPPLSSLQPEQQAPAPLPPGAIPIQAAAPLPPGATLVDPSQVSPIPPGYILDQPTPAAQTFSESRTGKVMWLAGILLLPPAVGYATIFLLIPWIYRGFRPANVE